MSPGGVANDTSVTLTLADAQGMLEGVTLNLNAQVTQQPREGALTLKLPVNFHATVRVFPSSGSNLSCLAGRLWSLRTDQLRPAGHTGEPPLPARLQSA